MSFNCKGYGSNLKQPFQFVCKRTLYILSSRLELRKYTAVSLVMLCLNHNPNSKNCIVNDTSRVRGMLWPIQGCESHESTPCGV